MQQERGIIESENWRGAKSTNYKDIVLALVSKITQISSQEFKKGWWKQGVANPNINQTIYVAYIPDTRESYSNAVEVLHDILMPKFDKKIKEEVEPLNERLDKLRIRYKKEQGFSLNDYKIRRRRLHRKLFQQICLFLERLGWLEALSIDD